MPEYARKVRVVLDRDCFLDSHDTVQGALDFLQPTSEPLRIQDKATPLTSQPSLGGLDDSRCKRSVT